MPQSKHGSARGLLARVRSVPLFTTLPEENGDLGGGGRSVSVTTDDDHPTTDEDNSNNNNQHAVTTGGGSTNLGSGGGRKFNLSQLHNKHVSFTLSTSEDEGRGARSDGEGGNSSGGKSGRDRRGKKYDKKKVKASSVKASATTTSMLMKRRNTMSDFSTGGGGGGGGASASIASFLQHHIHHHHHNAEIRVAPQLCHLEEDPFDRYQRHLERMQHLKRHSLVGVLGAGKVPRKVADLITKKRNGNEMSWEDMEFFVTGVENGSVSHAQAGAMLMAFHLVGLSMLECESLMKAMMFSGQLLHWPGQWVDSIASLQSIGSTGNKVKPIVASCMAAIGLKFPIMSSRGVDVFASILNRLNTIPKFNGIRSFPETQELLEVVGCCVVKQPGRVAPAEHHIRDIAAQVGCADNNNIKAACLMARVCAMKFRAVLLEITCGPSESIHSKEEAKDLVRKLQEMAKVMGVRCKVILTQVNGPVGKMIGQSLSVAETVRVLNGEGPDDLYELTCKLGGHILHEMNRVDTPANGEKLVKKVLKDGSAKKKFQAMLQSQGVDKATIRNLFKHRKDPKEMPSCLPEAQYFTHLSVPESGFIHTIDVTICNKVMFELARNNADIVDDDDDDDDSDESLRSCVGGIQLMAQIGTHLTRGDCWAKIHHNVRLTDDQVSDLKRAITTKPEPPLYDMTIDIQEVSSC